MLHFGLSPSTTLRGCDYSKRIETMTNTGDKLR